MISLITKVFLQNFRSHFFKPKFFCLFYVSAAFSRIFLFFFLIEVEFRLRSWTTIKNLENTFKLSWRPYISLSLYWFPRMKASNVYDNLNLVNFFLLFYQMCLLFCSLLHRFIAAIMLHNSYKYISLASLLDFHFSVFFSII